MDSLDSVLFAGSSRLRCARRVERREDAFVHLSDCSRPRLLSPSAEASLPLAPGQGQQRKAPGPRRGCDACRTEGDCPAHTLLVLVIPVRSHLFICRWSRARSQIISKRHQGKWMKLPFVRLTSLYSPAAEIAIACSRE